MSRHSASVTVRVPADICHATLRAVPQDARWHEAYSSLRPSRAYSGRIVADEPGRRLVLEESAIDPVTKARSAASGWTLEYAFEALPDGRTRVEVVIDYGVRAAVAGMGTMASQSETHILAHLREVLALEAGYLARAKGV